MPPIERSVHDIYPFISNKERLKDAARGKTVLITGAGSGAGRAMALTFAGAGATAVIVVGRTLQKLEETKNQVEAAHSHCTVHPMTADVTDAVSVDSLFANAPFTPDILINNAGACVSSVHVADSDPELWWRDMELNVKGVYLGTRAYLRKLDGKAGIIITVSSSICDNPDYNMSSYSAAKLAANRFMEIVQLEYGNQGVKAYAFHPGGMLMTGMGANCPPQYAEWLCDTVEQAAGVALYLSTPEAEYLKGRFVYGGWDLKRVQGLREAIVKDNLLVHKLDLGDKMSGTIVLDSGKRKPVRGRVDFGKA